MLFFEYFQFPSHAPKYLQYQPRAVVCPFPLQSALQSSSRTEQKPGIEVENAHRSRDGSCVRGREEWLSSGETSKIKMTFNKLINEFSSR